MVRDNDRKGREAFYGYLAAIRKMERDFNEYDGFVTPMTDAMDSYGSHLFRGLNDYRRHDRRDNEEWVRSYWFMFYDESKGEWELPEHVPGEATWFVHPIRMY